MNRWTSDENKLSIKQNKEGIKRNRDKAKKSALASAMQHSSSWNQIVYLARLGVQSLKLTRRNKRRKKGMNRGMDLKRFL